MSPRIITTVSVRSTESTTRRGKSVVAGAVLLAVCLILLWINRGFGLYAVTGFLWPRADGVVVSAKRTSRPIIQFQSRDGATQQFTEDYIRLCGASRDFCWIRDFNPGQAVSVVYDPASPSRAYVRDFALYSNVLSFFLELGAALLFGLILGVALFKRPITYSVRIGDVGDRTVDGGT